MLAFHETVASDFSAVNRMVVEELHSDVAMVENIGHYIIKGGGKRLRPLVVLLAAKALGYAGQEHIKLAAIVEFIHTATLLHDDVVDKSDRRRGRDTANAIWGNSPTVLVGDFLYSRAFQLMVQLQHMDIMDIMAQTTNIIAEGEVQQLVNAGNPDIGEDVYRATIFKKTAILFQAAAEAGGTLAGASREQRQTLAQYGCDLGMAFQLQDDVLDYQGDPQAMGKNLGDDLAEGKPTLPLIQAMRTGSAAERELIATALRESRIDQLGEILAIVRSTGSLDYCQRSAQAHADQAIAQLHNLPDSEYKATLEAIARFSISRSF